MSGTTPVEGYPYPLEADFADVQDAFRLATAIDTDLRAEQAPFRAFMGRPSFIARLTANGATSIIGTTFMQFQAIDWDNTGGALVNSFFWNQPLSQAPSWWLFGSTILVNNAAAGAVGDLVLGQIEVSTVDQVTGVGTDTSFYQRNDESNTGGEWVNMFAMAPIFQGNAGVALNVNGTTLKGLGAGSRLWGMYMGPVT